MLPKTLLFPLLVAIPISPLVIDKHAVESRAVDGKLVVQANVNVANSSVHHPTLNLEVCGTGPPSDHLKDTHSNLRGNSGEGSRLAAQDVGPLTVQVFAHFVSTKDQASRYSVATRNKMIKYQMSALNTAYASSKIAFTLNNTSYTIQDAWATDAQSGKMKSSLRRGTYRDLNLYFQTNLSSAPYTYSASNSLLGYCTLPTSVTYTNPSTGKPQSYDSTAYAQDGCSILSGSMPGSPVSLEGYNLGKTAVHEIGHWFGLLHVFQGNTCKAGDAGDYMDDTPQQSTATSGCPKGKDSCPGIKGADAVSNYMDYSTDACYTGFTPMQQSRMINMFNQYRKGQ